MNTLNFDNQFVKKLPADKVEENYPRQVQGACYSWVKPKHMQAPAMVAYSTEAAELLGLTEQDCESSGFLNAFSGNEQLDGMQAYATCYGGHQFGNWAGQLGDGRAINLGDIINQQGERWALQLKGAGPTPYSRTADGLAVLRSSIREFLCSEAMYHLGVPTTRALSLVTTGEEVVRDVMYDGNPAPELGAVVCRLAPSFTRFGHFQYYAQQDNGLLKQFVDYTISTDFLHLLKAGAELDKQTYLTWFQEVCDTTCDMIVGWMRVGFVHGVMNTDNMSILGLTIDYGPYGWLESYDPNWTPNTTDSQHHRYAFGQQAQIAHWNLYQLANAIYSLINEVEPLEKILNGYAEQYQCQWNLMMVQKLGFSKVLDDDADNDIVQTLFAFFAEHETDMTLFFRQLMKLKTADFSQAIEVLSVSFYAEIMNEKATALLKEWLTKYHQRTTADPTTQEQRQTLMQRVNPKYVLRNYLAQQAIEKAEQGNYAMVHELMSALKNPYDEQPQYEHLAQKRPDWAKHKVGCSMLSCSS
ncbi:MAG: protein adenylyltransferase SelO [Cycloclasticus sp.]